MNWLPLIIFSISCSSSSSSSDVLEELQREGQITYPFFEDEKPIGINSKKDKLVIRTESPHGRAYILEIPGGGDDYGIEIPLQDLDLLENKKSINHARALTTDQELAGPPLQNLEEPAPSYTLKIAEIKDLYRKDLLDEALININYLMEFWPTKVDLMKMKATILEKMGYLDQAKNTLEKASPLSHGGDKEAIEQKLAYLREKLKK